MKKPILYLILLSLTALSCRKIIEIDTKNAEPQLVIEGNITDRFAAQQIRLSKSVAYDSKSVFPTVSGAVVSVKDDRGNTYNFTESQAGVYVSNLRGIPGVTYTMQVQVAGKSYTASSKMPISVKLDSIGIVKASFFGNERKTAAAFFTDPAAFINYYHFNLYVNDQLSDRVYVSSDRLTNGNALRYQLYYSKSDDDDDGLKTGDKIAVEMECTDAAIYDFWYALSQQDGRGPNQGTTPSNPTSNISGGALGYFSAHTFQRMSSTIP